MLTLVGHGYVGSVIAEELRRQEILFDWQHARHFRAHGQVIINAAGYTGHPNVDACETNKEECIRGNIIWPMRVHNESAGLPIINISSGCVYNGYEKEWTEEDDPNFDMTNGSFYSGCKAINDRWFRQINKRSYLLRMRMPFGPKPHPKNLITKLASYPKLINQLQSMSSVEDVARAAVWFALNLPKPGIYNCVNPGGVEIASIDLAMGWGKEYFQPDEFKRVIAAPRSECLLSTAKMQEVFPLRSAAQAIHETVKAYHVGNT